VEQRFQRCIDGPMKDSDPARAPQLPYPPRVSAELQMVRAALATLKKLQLINSMII
jgi:hypothetical protein